MSLFPPPKKKFAVDSEFGKTKAGLRRGFEPVTSWTRTWIRKRAPTGTPTWTQLQTQIRTQTGCMALSVQKQSV